MRIYIPVAAMMLLSACSLDTTRTEEQGGGVVRYPASWGRVVSVGGRYGQYVTVVDSLGVARVITTQDVSAPAKIIPVVGLDAEKIPPIQLDGVVVTRP